MDIYIQVFVWIYVCNPFEFLGCMVTLRLIFWGTARLFSTVAAPIYISTNSMQGLLFLHTLTNTCYFLSFWWEPSKQVWGCVSLWFWFPFPWWFSCTCWPFVCFLCNSISFPVPTHQRYTTYGLWVGAPTSGGLGATRASSWRGSFKSFPRVLPLRLVTAEQWA